MIPAAQIRPNYTVFKILGDYLLVEQRYFGSAAPCYEASQPISGVVEFE